MSAFHRDRLCSKYRRSSAGWENRHVILLEKLLALIAAALVAIAFGVGLMMMAFGPMQTGGGAPAPMLAKPLDKGEARQRIETLIASTPDYARYFARMRESFTGDYESAIDEFAKRMAATRQEQTVDYYLSEAVRRLRQAHGGMAAKAESEPMSQVFAKQLDVLRAVAQQDKKMCVAFLYGATNLDFQRFAATRRPLVAEMALAGLEAMISGRDKKIAREQPTEADFRALETALAGKGLEKVEIEALLDGKTPNPPLDDAKMCAAGQTYFEVLKTLPEPARSRVYGLALELMAKS